MRNTLMCVLLCAVSAAVVRGQGVSVDAIERQRLNAVLHNDVAVLDGILAADWVMTSATGERLTKRQYLDQLASGQRRYDVLEHEELSVTTHGPVAIITGRTRAVWRDASGEHRTIGRFTHVYLRERSQWLMLAVHVSAAQPTRE